jgi:hypothetical protein
MSEKDDKAKVSIDEESITHIEWFWVFGGTFMGILIVGSLVTISSFVFTANPAIPMLIGGLSFIVTGMILGHFSPGHTIKETTIVGLLIPVIIIAIVNVKSIDSFMLNLTLVQGAIIVLGSMLLTQIGGWVGDELEGYDHPTKFIQWHWIVVASLIGFVLNCYVLFFVAITIFKLIPILIFLGLSLIAAGIIAGYKSPGHTEMECSIAGVVTIILEYIFLKFVLQYSDELLPITYLLIGIAAGAVFGLLGGWIGEKFQKEEEDEKKELE